MQDQELRCPNCRRLLFISNIQVIKGEILHRCKRCGWWLRIESDTKWRIYQIPKPEKSERIFDPLRRKE